ncbi:MAG: 7-carboxy-7-deazaguanine synthase QueE [Candidatus Ratteibacteria bacterium]|nr:7-carboxy-7-deazaguanine synthase QueE [Candidatus Ratteibacteria bacterium]
MIYNISEIFYSLQGEGLLQGIPVVFIRLSGCNLRCSFCDTKYAWEKGKKEGIKEIIKKIERYPSVWVCITGGEPFLQKLSPLVDALKKKRYRVSVETNGTIWQDIRPDWITVSPKREGMMSFRHGYDERFLKIADEFKYVITEKSDIELIDHRVKVPVVLQPVDNNLKIANWVVDALKRHPYKNWYLRIQMQKVINIK